MKTLSGILLLCSTTFIYTSCIEIFNYVTVDEDSNVITSVQLVIDKKMYNLYGRGAENPPSITDVHYGDLQKYISSFEAHTETDYVLHNKITLPIHELDTIKQLRSFSDLSPFIIQKSDDYYTIDFKYGLYNPEDFDTALEKNIFESSTYTIIVSKKYINTITDVFIQEEGVNKKKSLQFFDLTDSYLIYVPLKLCTPWATLTIQ